MRVDHRGHAGQDVDDGRRRGSDRASARRWPAPQGSRCRRATAAIAEESIASSISDAPESGGMPAPAGPSIDAGLDVSAVPAGEATELEHPASTNTDAKSTNTGRRRLIELLGWGFKSPPGAHTRLVARQWVPDVTRVRSRRSHPNKLPTTVGTAIECPIDAAATPFLPSTMTCTWWWVVTGTSTWGVGGAGLVGANSPTRPRCAAPTSTRTPPAVRLHLRRRIPSASHSTINAHSTRDDPCRRSCGRPSAPRKLVGKKRGQ